MRCNMLFFRLFARRKPTAPPNRPAPGTRRLLRAAALILALFAGASVAQADDDAENVLAVVNGQALPIAEAQAQFDYYAPLYVTFGQNDALDKLRRDIARAAVQRALILADCRRLGIEADARDREALHLQAQTDYAALLEGQCAVQKGTDGGTRLAEAEKTLAASGITAASLYARALEDLLIARHESFVTAGIQIDEEALRAAYEARLLAQKAAYSQSPTLFERAMLKGETVCYIPAGARRIRHILILADTDDRETLSELFVQRTSAANPAEIDAQIAETAAFLLDRADMLLARLNAGESFAALMAEYQNDSRIRPSPFTGGEYGYVAESGPVWEDALRAAALSLRQIGEVSAPIVTPLGVHLIQHAGDLEQGAVAFEAVRIRLEEELTQQAKEQAYEERITALFESADIIWYDDRLEYPES